MNGLSYFSPNYPVHITPLVSVVLIARRVYDCEKCLDTLMKQSTTFETEVIVVDRSSTDEIERLCRRHTSFYHSVVPEPRYAAVMSSCVGIMSGGTTLVNYNVRESICGSTRRVRCVFIMSKEMFLYSIMRSGDMKWVISIFYIYFGIILRFSVWRVLRASILFFYTSGEESFLCIGRSVERCNAFPV